MRGTAIPNAIRILDAFAVRHLTGDKVIRELYGPAHKAFLDRKPLELVRGLRELASSFTEDWTRVNQKIKKSVRGLLDAAAGEFYAEAVRIPGEESGYAVLTIEAARLFVPLEEFNSFGLELLERAFKLKDPSIPASLSTFLELSEALSPREKEQVSSLYYRIGQDMLTDPSVEEPLLQIIALSDMFYFNVYDFKVAELIFGAARKLFSEGQKAAAMEHLAQVWRNVRRKSDPTAMDIFSEVKTVLLDLFGVPEAMISAYSTREDCLKNGVSEDFADAVSGMTKSVMQGMGVDDVLMSLRVIGRPMKSSNGVLLNELLSAALSTEIVVRQNSLKALEELLARNVNNNPDKGLRFLPKIGWARIPAFEVKIGVLKKFSDIFGDERYSPISLQLRAIELKQLGEIIYSLRNKEDQLRSLLSGMMTGEAALGGYLSEKIFDIPHLEQEKFAKRFNQLFTNIYYSMLATRKIPQLKRFIRSLKSEKTFWLCCDLRDILADSYFDAGKKDKARDVYEQWRAGEDPSSIDFQAATFMLGVQTLVENKAEEARKYFDEVLRSNPGKGAVAFYLACSHYELGQMSLESGDLEGAERHLRESTGILEGGPEHPSTKGAYRVHIYELARVLLQGKKYAEAEPLLRKALELCGGEFTFCNNIIYLFCNTGRGHEAFLVIKDFVKKYGDSAESMSDTKIYTNLFDLYRDFSKEGKSYQKAEVLQLLANIAKKHKAVMKKAAQEFETEEGEQLPNEIRNFVLA